MKNRLYIVICMGISLLMSACVTSRKVNMMQKSGGDIPVYKDTLSYEDYLLKKEDRLYIHVYSIDEKIANLFNTGQSMRQNVQGDASGAMDLYTYSVDENGDITVPTVGKLQVLGLTTRQVKRLLEDELSCLVKSYDEYAAISVDVQVVGRSFSVIGPTKSGRYPISKEKVTIFEALALVGDLSDIADKKEIMLIRDMGDSTVVKKFDLRSEDIVNSEFYYIEPNDVIYVRYMPGYSFGLNHVTSTISIVASTISFGVFIYSVVDRIAVRANTKEEGGTQ